MKAANLEKALIEVYFELIPDADPDPCGIPD